MPHRDPEERRRYNRQWRAKNLLAVRARQAAWARAWGRENPQASVDRVAAYRRRKLVRILERDGWRCTYCQAVLTETTGTRDHKVPRSKGGTDTDRNVVAACLRCNLRKQDKTYAEFRRLMRREAEQARLAADPTAVPTWVTEDETEDE